MGSWRRGFLMQEHIPDYAMIAAPPTEERFYARSDPLWVQRLALGLDLCTFYVVLLAAAAVLGISYAVNVIPAWWTDPEWVRSAAMVFGFVGVWLLTSPDTDRPEPKPHYSRRRWLRIVATSYLVLISMPYPVYWLLRHVHEYGDRWLTLSIQVTFCVLFYVHVRDIARYALATKALRHAAIVFYGYLVAVLFGQVFPLATEIGLVPVNDRRYPIAPQALGGMMMLLFLAYAAWVTRELRRTMHECARAAVGMYVGKSAAAPVQPL